MQLLVFEKFTSAYLPQIALKVILWHVNNLHDYRIIESQDGRNFGSARYS